MWSWFYTLGSVKMSAAAAAAAAAAGGKNVMFRDCNLITTHV
jgi:hypothetical protein